MDRNTITGFLLIAALMFGFYYCSKPPVSNQRSNSETSTVVETENALTTEPFTSADTVALAAALRTVGTHSNGSYTYVNDQLEISLDSAGNFSGNVKLNDTVVSLASVLTNNAGLNLNRTYRAVGAVRGLINRTARYGGFARYSEGETREAVLENDLVKIILSSQGGAVKQVILKKYDTELGETPQPIELFKGENDGYGFIFNTEDQRIDTRNFNFELSQPDSNTVMMAMHPENGATWAIRYSLPADSYVLGMTVVQEGMENILPLSTSSMEFNWHQKMARNEKGRTFEERNSAIYYKYVGESPDDISSAKNETKTLNGRLRWVAFKNQFFSSVIIARDAFTSADVTSNVIKNSPEFLKDMSMQATVPYSVADGDAASFDFYFGPNLYPLLSSLDKTLDVGENLSLTRLIPLGWGLFRWINTLIVIPVFSFLSQNMHIANYGIIILLLTIFIKLILFPFTYKSFKSQAKMKALAPEIKAINEKYPGQDNAIKRQQETMALYSRAGASPFAGCLPMLLQMPVLIAMFSFFPSAIELRGESFLWAHDLSAPDSILTLPFSIPFYGNHVSLFCLLMTAVNIIYIRISMSSQPTSEGMPGMKFMQYLMPIMFLFIFNDYASGLSYYYFVSLLITIVQTWVFRHFTDENKLRAEMAENAKKGPKKSGFMARLEKMAKEAEAAQRAQAKRRK